MPPYQHRHLSKVLVNVLAILRLVLALDHACCPNVLRHNSGLLETNMDARIYSPSSLKLMRPPGWPNIELLLYETLKSSGIFKPRRGVQTGALVKTRALSNQDYSNETVITSNP